MPLYEFPYKCYSVKTGNDIVTASASTTIKIAATCCSCFTSIALDIVNVAAANTDCNGKLHVVLLKHAFLMKDAMFLTKPDLKRSVGDLLFDLCRF